MSTLNTKLTLRAGEIQLDKDTKVIATRTGYSDFIREIGDIFYVKKGTIVGLNCWFEPVDVGTVTTEEAIELESLSSAELKIRLNRLKVDTTGISKKSDLIALLARVQAENGEDLA